jgi:hypothetical protein
MRSLTVVLFLPFLNDHLSLVDGPEPVRTQAFVPERPIEGFDEAVLGRLARLYKIELGRKRGSGLVFLSCCRDEGYGGYGMGFVFFWDSAA